MNAMDLEDLTEDDAKEIALKVFGRKGFKDLRFELHSSITEVCSSYGRNLKTMMEIMQCGVSLMRSTMQN